MVGPEEVENRIRQIMKKRLQISLEADSRTKKPTMRELGLDSMSTLELIVGIEQEFGISLVEEEFNAEEHFRDLQSVTQLVLQVIAKQPG